jgi:hypothetical protein
MGSQRDDIKLEAAWLRLCLAYGLRDTSAVQAWAEDHLRRADKPPAGLVELVGASHAGVQDVMDLLAAVPGRVAAGAARARVFAELAACLRAYPDALTDIVGRLRRMALNGDAPDEAAADEIDTFDAQCSRLDDDVALADGSRVCVLAFLDRHAAIPDQPAPERSK